MGKCGTVIRDCLKFEKESVVSQRPSMFQLVMRAKVYLENQVTFI